MSRLRILALPVTVSLILPVIISGGGCVSNKNFNESLHEITGPYNFSIMSWELNALRDGVGEAFREDSVEDTETTTRDVTGFFENVEMIKRLEAEIGALKDKNGEAPLPPRAELFGLQRQNEAANDDVEAFLEKQIREAFSEQGIRNPLVGGGSFFPPLNFELSKLPHLLVVSPRERIESMREITLLPEMTVEEMESLEQEVDELGVSSLVLEIGGMATYPSLVSERGNLRFVLNTAAEEWLHQYLVFKPLGFRYLLDLAGISRNYEIATMNETLAGMVAREIGDIVYEENYAAGEENENGSEDTGQGFDFNREMREIRKAVDVYLAQGEIEQAEAFMEERRQYLADNGYYIRKLNQAYFAFHGAYADRPTSISPIGVEMRELRDKSESLKDFLETAAALTNRQDLALAVE